jgi:hypothetical protein
MTISRRSVVRNTGLMGAALMAQNLPLWALADAHAASKAPKKFENISSTLLGVDTDVLEPKLVQDDCSLSGLYYSVLEEGAPDALKDLEAYYDILVALGYTPQQIGNKLLRDPDDSHEPLAAPSGVAARLTMFMWLFGIWYGGTEIGRLPSSASSVAQDYQVDFVVSARAYKNGWIWRFAQAHPMGFSHYRFGSWASPPPPLSDFTNPLA